MPDDRLTRQIPQEPAKKHADEGGPAAPKIGKPNGNNELLKRLKRVDPDQAKKYRQRSGE